VPVLVSLVLASVMKTHARMWSWVLARPLGEPLMGGQMAARGRLRCWRSSQESWHVDDWHSGLSGVEVAEATHIYLSNSASWIPSIKLYNTLYCTLVRGYIYKLL